jgi:hypothetical protein
VENAADLGSLLLFRVLFSLCSSHQKGLGCLQLREEFGFGQTLGLAASQVLDAPDTFCELCPDAFGAGYSKLVC